MNVEKEPTLPVTQPTRKRGPVKPEGYIEDPEERRSLADELQGSCPDMVTQEESQRMRWKSRAPIKPAGFTEDPIERARMVEQLHGSCPNFMSQEELQRRRWES